MSRLTERQTAVLQHARNGLLTKQIAHEMKLSCSCVKIHARAARQKIGARNTVQAVADALEMGLIK